MDYNSSKEEYGGMWNRIGKNYGVNLVHSAYRDAIHELLEGVPGD